MQKKENVNELIIPIVSACLFILYTSSYVYLMIYLEKIGIDADKILLSITDVVLSIKSFWILLAFFTVPLLFGMAWDINNTKRNYQDKECLNIEKKFFSAFNLVSKTNIKHKNLIRFLPCISTVITLILGCYIIHKFQSLEYVSIAALIVFIPAFIITVCNYTNFNIFLGILFALFFVFTLSYSFGIQSANYDINFSKELPIFYDDKSKKYFILRTFDSGMIVKNKNNNLFFIQKDKSIIFLGAAKNAAKTAPSYSKDSNPTKNANSQSEPCKQL